MPAANLKEFPDFPEAPRQPDCATRSRGKFSVGAASQTTWSDIMKEQILLHVEELEERIAPSSANFAPGQFPSGNPAHAPGLSNPNEVPATNPSND
jgi:hypothetical protein